MQTGYDYDDIISPDYMKKNAVQTALESLIQVDSHVDGKDKHFVTLAILESSCNPKRKLLQPFLRSPTLLWESKSFAIPCAVSINQNWTHHQELNSSVSSFNIHVYLIRLGNFKFSKKRLPKLTPPQFLPFA